MSTDFSSIVHVSTNLSYCCKLCGTSIGGEYNFAESVNHFIDKHGYKVMHVGQETTRGMDGENWQSTVAVLGR